MVKQSPTQTKLEPALVSLLSDVITPLAAFHRLGKEEKTAFLFESTETDTRLARFSFIGVDPAKTISIRDGKAEIVDRLANTSETRSFENPLHLLAEILNEFRLQCGTLKLFEELPFTGGLVGYIGYAATQYFEGIAKQAEDPFNVPEIYYGLYDSAVVFDHLKRRIHVISYRGADHAQKLARTLLVPDQMVPIFDDAKGVIDASVFDRVSGPFSKETFMNAVGTCKGFVEEGQVFQIVVSQRFSLPVSKDAFAIYRVLQSLNPSPYAYFLKCPGFDYIGSSPETFVKCQDGEVVLKALAGTRPRGETKEDDEHLARELQENEKELAEHRMLVDLGRNDLGRICTPGTIKVGEIATLTRYAHVMHLSTEIKGKLRSDKTSFDAVRSCFPRGTVSGAPKIRAMKLLSALEPEQRGIYSGVVGYFDLSGNSDGAIAIRSALLKDGYAHVNAGAGIVYDSEAAAEYEETRNKAKSLIKAIKVAEANTSC